MSVVLEVRDLAVQAGNIDILHPMSFIVEAGQTVAVTGESGSGKSTLARAIMGLLPEEFSLTGEIIFENQNLKSLPENAMRLLRGNRIAMVFQEPMTALNPIRRIGNQIADTLRLHGQTSGHDIKARTQTLLDRVGLTKAGVSQKAYPHMLSGGQRQRVLLAMAIACRPSLLVADEFTTALDARTQAEIMVLVEELARENNMAVLLISHDLGLIRHYAKNTVIMRNGKIVESGDTEQIFTAPSHPYTQALLSVSLHGTRHEPLRPIPVPAAIYQEAEA